MTFDVFNCENPQAATLRSDNAVNDSGVGSETFEILSEYDGSRFFSAERHYQRSMTDQSSQSAINMDTLQFNNLVLGNSDQITMEARTLLGQWMDRADFDASSDKRSTDAVKDILYDLQIKPIRVIRSDMVICLSCNI
jgi:hypothetical protein